MRGSAAARRAATADGRSAPGRPADRRRQRAARGSLRTPRTAGSIRIQAHAPIPQIAIVATTSQ